MRGLSTPHAPDAGTAWSSTNAAVSTRSRLLTTRPPAPVPDSRQGTAEGSDERDTTGGRGRAVAGRDPRGAGRMRTHPGRIAGELPGVRAAAPPARRTPAGAGPGAGMVRCAAARGQRAPRCAARRRRPLPAGGRAVPGPGAAAPGRGGLFRRPGPRRLPGRSRRRTRRLRRAVCPPRRELPRAGVGVARPAWSRARSARAAAPRRPALNRRRDRWLSHGGEQPPAGPHATHGLGFALLTPTCCGTRGRRLRFRRHRAPAPGEGEFAPWLVVPRHRLVLAVEDVAGACEQGPVAV